jgi:hypothetical protein
MSIKQIFQKAQVTGQLSNKMKVQIEQICAPDSQLSKEEYLYLDLLMGAIFSGEIH